MSFNHVHLYCYLTCNIKGFTILFSDYVIFTGMSARIALVFSKYEQDLEYYSQYLNSDYNTTDVYYIGILSYIHATSAIQCWW